MPLTASDFRTELLRRLDVAKSKGLEYIDVNAGELHRDLGDYPGDGGKTKHRMPLCCKVMLDRKTDADEIMRAPAKGHGASLTIRYWLRAPSNHYVRFDILQLGKEYTRHDLVALWGYKTYNAIGLGVVTPQKQKRIVLFVQGTPASHQTQYDNAFDGETLWMDGALDGKGDKRLANSLENDEEVALFFRDEHDDRYRYCGRVYLVGATLHDDKPSRFVLTVDKQLATAADADFDDEGPNDPEGMKRYRMHVVYERSPENRRKALKFHKPICAACDFDFNKFYGEELAKSFIQIHHRTSITQLDGRRVDPEKDLVPLCPNCHCMVHRQRGVIVPVEELRALVQKRRGH